MSATRTKSSAYTRVKEQSTIKSHTINSFFSQRVGLAVILLAGMVSVSACRKQSLESEAPKLEVISQHADMPPLATMYTDQLTATMEQSPIGQMAADYYADLLAASYAAGNVRSYLNGVLPVRSRGSASDRIIAAIEDGSIVDSQTGQPITLAMLSEEERCDLLRATLREEYARAVVRLSQDPDAQYAFAMQAVEQSEARERAQLDRTPYRVLLEAEAATKSFAELSHATPLMHRSQEACAPLLRSSMTHSDAIDNLMLSEKAIRYMERYGMTLPAEVQNINTKNRGGSSGSSSGSSGSSSSYPVEIKFVNLRKQWMDCAEPGYLLVRLAKHRDNTVKVNWFDFGHVGILIDKIYASHGSKTLVSYDADADRGVHRREMDEWRRKHYVNECMGCTRHMG